jgi:hypothetical protein
MSGKVALLLAEGAQKAMRTGAGGSAALPLVRPDQAAFTVDWNLPMR